MEQVIGRLKREIKSLEEDANAVKNRISLSVIYSAIEERERQIQEIIAKDKKNTVNLSCREEDSAAFELAITQLGYKITDSTWDDEKETMFYTAKG